MRRSKVGRIHIVAIIQKDDGTITNKSVAVDYNRAESMFISRLFLDNVKKYCDKSKIPQSAFQDDMGEYKTYFLPHKGTKDSVISYFIGLCEEHLRWYFDYHKAISDIKEFFETTITECKEYMIHFLDKDNNAVNWTEIKRLIHIYDISPFPQKDEILNKICRMCWGSENDDITEYEVMKARHLLPYKSVGNDRAVLVVNRETIAGVIKGLSKM